MADWRSFLKDNSSALTQMGAGLLGGQTGTAQLAGAFSGFNQGRQQNKTLEYLREKDPELASLVEQGALTGGDAAKLYYNRKLESEKPTEYSQRASALGQYGIDPNSEQGRSFILTGDLKSSKPDNPYMSVGGAIFDRNTQQWITPPAGADGQPKTGYTPIWGKKDGKNVLMLPTDNGQVIQPTTPDGVELSGPYGTEYDKANGKTIGGATGGAQVQLSTAQQAADEAIAQAEAIKNDSNLPAVLGGLDSMTPTFLPGSVNVQSKIDQLKSGSFLQARQLLKGGGAITDYEGAKAEQALARLDPRMSPDDFKRALGEYQDHIRKGMQILQQQAGGNFAQPGAPTTQPGRTSSGVSFTVEP